jgi:hypothetical protein
MSVPVNMSVHFLTGRGHDPYAISIAGIFSFLMKTIFGLPLSYAYGTLRQSVAGN